MTLLKTCGVVRDQQHHKPQIDFSFNIFCWSCNFSCLLISIVYSTSLLLVRNLFLLWMVRFHTQQFFQHTRTGSQNSICVTVDKKNLEENLLKHPENFLKLLLCERAIWQDAYANFQQYFPWLQQTPVNLDAKVFMQRIFLVYFH